MSAFTVTCPPLRLSVPLIRDTSFEREAQAAQTILDDYVTNRQTRELDRLCHAFVARHLPSAGHLRYVSSVLRLGIALERIGDYATTVSRTAAQLAEIPPPVVVRDIEMMSEQARRAWRQSPPTRVLRTHK